MEPYIKSFIMCDSVGKDISGRPIFSGVFDRLRGITFPSVISFCIITEWVVEGGNYKEEIKVLTQQKDKTYFEIPPRNFSSDKQVSVKKFILPLTNFPLYKPGMILWFQVFLNEKLYTEVPVAIETKISRIIGGKK